MKIPVSPPDLGDIFRAIADGGIKVLSLIMEKASPVDSKGRYCTGINCVIYLLRKG